MNLDWSVYISSLARRLTHPLANTPPCLRLTTPSTSFLNLSCIPRTLPFPFLLFVVALDSWFDTLLKEADIAARGCVSELKRRACGERGDEFAGR